MNCTGFTPTFQLGCRRVTPGDPYIEAIQRENVDVHFTSVARLTKNGVMGADGIERKVDAVICATGKFHLNLDFSELI
jgi:cation diffusion facilitator CzcD-associated flavoprotein CzcO